LCGFCAEKRLTAATACTRGNCTLTSLSEQTSSLAPFSSTRARVRSEGPGVVPGEVQAHRVSSISHGAAQGRIAASVALLADQPGCRGPLPPSPLLCYGLPVRVCAFSGPGAAFTMDSRARLDPRLPWGEKI